MRRLFAIILVMGVCVVSDQMGELLLKYCEQGNLKGIRELIRSGVDINKDYAVVRNDFNEELYKKGYAQIYKDKYALAVAAEHGQANAVELLIANGAKVSGPGPKARTPLYFAACGGHSNVARILLKHGADVHSNIDLFHTPLHCATTRDMVRLLIEHGANVNAVNYDKSTPLHDATYFGGRSVEVVKALIEAGANVNAKDASEHTPIYKAFVNGNVDKVQVLIEHGANLNVQDMPFIFQNRKTKYVTYY